MRSYIGRGVISASLSVLVLAHAAKAQDGAAFRSRDWRGNPIDYVQASLGDAEGLRQALIRQELFRIVDAKAETGWYYGDRLRCGARPVKPAARSSTVQRRLQADAATLRTGALIYDVGSARGQPMPCVWLLTPAHYAAERCRYCIDSRAPGSARRARMRASRVRAAPA